MRDVLDELADDQQIASNLVTGKAALHCHPWPEFWSEERGYRSTATASRSRVARRVLVGPCVGYFRGSGAPDEKRIRILSLTRRVEGAETGMAAAVPGAARSVLGRSNSSELLADLFTKGVEGGVMFVQVIQGKAKDPAALRNHWERWDEQLKPTANGFLGSTAGVTANGEFIALVRFENEAAARANSDRAEQSDWWRQTSQYLDDPMFHDCTLVDLINDGGSDDAGFVQVIQGKVTDVDKARELDKAMQDQLNRLRPDVIGGIVAWHPQNGRFTNAMYFSSEVEARAKEKETSNAPEFEKYMSEYQAISDGDPKFLDITEPWYSST